MRSRCSNPNVPAFKNYGGRGIVVCEGWASFEAFAGWASATGYRDDLTIERRNADLGYEPGNCCWIPHGDQAANRRNVPVAPDGRPWSHLGKENGLLAQTVAGRLKLGWTPERAVLEPTRRRRSA